MSMPGGLWCKQDSDLETIIWQHSNVFTEGAYTILEHFADNSEEATLSDMGMLLWG